MESNISFWLGSTNGDGADGFGPIPRPGEAKLPEQARSDRSGNTFQAGVLKMAWCAQEEGVTHPRRRRRRQGGSQRESGGQKGA